VQLGLDLDAAVLDERLALRVDHMWERGLVDEVRGLESLGLRDGRTAGRALGYAQVLRLLDGELTGDEAVRQTVQATRRFVRRQRSWFGRDPGVRWLDAAAPDLVDRALGVARAR
jgi:tRNA dimethylallyltransferase